MFDFLKQKDRTPPALPEGTVRRRYSISGQVQGVGFRYRARYAAQTKATISRSPASAKKTCPRIPGSAAFRCADTDIQKMADTFVSAIF